jgi:hypothetical protein
MPTTKRKTSNMVTYVSVLILVGTEIYGVAFAFAWAIAGYLELPQSATIALYIVSGIAATWIMYQFGRSAYGVDDRLDAMERRKAG